MDASEITEICRLCPCTGDGEELLNVFDERLSVKNNMKEVILVTTGIEIQESDIISKKICHKCCTKTLQMFLFRQNALVQDRALKEKCNRLLEDRGIKLPNTCITIKRERQDFGSPSKRPKVEPEAAQAKKPVLRLHPTVAAIYTTYASIKLPKKCLDKHWAPVVSCTMDEVERYFKKRNLDMKKFIYKPGAKRARNNVARKRTSAPAKTKVVSPIKIRKLMTENQDDSIDSSTVNYVCTMIGKNSSRKKIVSGLESENINGTEAECSKSTISEALDEAAAPLGPVIPDEAANGKELDVVRVNKPEFIESLGLTPRVTATKSHTLHICNLCGSVHNNAFKLKTHMRKHMVCQFCKLRFKTVESKEDHIDNACQVKEILNSTGPFVELERVHENLDVRKKFRSAFASFENIPGLEKDLMHSGGDVIDLCDDADTANISNRDSNKPAQTDIVIRPDVKITNDVVMDSLENDLPDKKIVKVLLGVLKLPVVRKSMKVTQTDLPITRDIKINNAEGYCEFKHLKNQLLYYRVPISISNGPFNVAYHYKPVNSAAKSMALWDDLPAHDIYRGKENDVASPSTSVLTQSKTLSGTSLATVQAQNSPVVKQVSARRSTPAAINNNNNKPAVATRSYVNSPYRKKGPPPLVKTGNISRRSLPANLILPGNSVSVNIPSLVSSTVNINLVSEATKGHVKMGSSTASSSLQETSKVRVKNVWELQ